MIWISVLFLAVAVSFDSLAIGASYGLNGILIPLSSKGIMSLVSGFSLLLAMAFQSSIEHWIHPSVSAILGGLLFIVLGIYNLWRSYGTGRKSSPRKYFSKKHSKCYLQIPMLNSLFQVFREPLKADRDHSQHITGWEAMILGAVLALDALAAGFGAALLHLPPWPTALAVVIASFIFISKGLEMGLQLRKSPKPQHDLRWVPGITILILGLLKMFL